MVILLEFRDEGANLLGRCGAGRVGRDAFSESGGLLIGDAVAEFGGEHREAAIREGLTRTSAEGCSLHLPRNEHGRAQLGPHLASLGHQLERRRERPSVHRARAAREHHQ